MFPGRTTVMKELLGRAIVDAVAEIAGPPRENVQVLFSEVRTDEWAIGPTLVSSRPAPGPHQYVPALVAVESVTLKPGAGDDYVAWRRDAVLPFLATQQGFLSSTLLRADGGGFVVIEKWACPQARERSFADKRAGELRAEAARFVERATDAIEGRVVDVFHGRSPK